jgi:hypothetical protein
MEWTIARDRWRSHLKTRGQYYADMASSLETLHRQSPRVGAGMVAMTLKALSILLERARVNRLTRNQHILFRLGEWIALGESATALCRYASDSSPKISGLDAQTVQAISRIYAREAAVRVVTEGLRWISSALELDDASFTELERTLNLSAIHRAQSGLLADMDAVAEAIKGMQW